MNDTLFDDDRYRPPARRPRKPKHVPPFDPDATACCDVWRKVREHASRPAAIVHQLCHRRVPFTVDAVATLADCTKHAARTAIESACAAEWCYKLTGNKVFGADDPDLWNGKL